MEKLVLNSATIQLPIQHLVDQVAAGGLELLDLDGKTVAFVLSPADQESRTYAEAHLDLNQNEAEVREALGRRGGVTTAELLQNARAAETQNSAR